MKCYTFYTDKTDAVVDVISRTANSIQYASYAPIIKSLNDNTRIGYSCCVKNINYDPYGNTFCTIVCNFYFSNINNNNPTNILTGTWVYYNQTDKSGPFPDSVELNGSYLGSVNGLESTGIFLNKSGTFEKIKSTGSNIRTYHVEFDESVDLNFL